MKYNDETRCRANEIINKHIQSGLSYNDAVKATIITLECMLSTTNTPYFETSYQKSLNYIKTLV